MKLKQHNLKAVLPSESVENAEYTDKDTLQTYIIIDKSTGAEIVRCVVEGSKRGSTVYANVWVNTKNGLWISGRGKAGGHGYDKMSASIGDALDDAGITLWGDIYGFSDTKASYKNKARLGGSGSQKRVLLAVAHAAGYNTGYFIEA